MLPNIVLFEGQDTAGEDGLWETNGTGSGTFELAPIGGADASGLSPSNLTLFNGEVLFEGGSTPAATLGCGRQTARPWALWS